MRVYIFHLVLGLVLVLPSVGPAMAKGKEAKASQSKTTNVSKRKIAQALQLSAREFISKTKVQSGKDYNVVKGDLDNCLIGELVVRSNNDGTLSLMLGDRLLAYKIADGKLKSDISERDCKIIVKTKFDGKKLNFEENYTCKKATYGTKKEIDFTQNKGDKPGSFSYTVVTHKNGKTEKPMVCHMEVD